MIKQWDYNIVPLLLVKQWVDVILVPVIINTDYIDGRSTSNNGIVIPIILN
jgi:hypothetical protein